MGYTVVFAGTRKKIKVPDATCAHEAEVLARKRNPAHANDSVYDICRSSGNSSSSPTNRRTKELSE